MRSFHNITVISSCLWVSLAIWAPAYFLLLVCDKNPLARLPFAIFIELAFLTLTVGTVGVPLQTLTRIGFWTAAVLMGVLGAKRLTLRASLKTKTNQKAWFLAGLATVLVSFDFLYVLGVQGWEWETGRFISESYFRGAFLTDAERNVILVNSILRGEESPFLPEFPLRFQLLPFKLIAFFTGTKEPLTRFSEVQGISAAFGLTLFWLIVCWALHSRPKWLRSPALFVAILIGVFCHSDWAHLAISYWKEGKWGIEADGSSAWFYFRYFSVKLMALLSPHHSLFCLFALGFFYSRKFLAAKSGRLISVLFGATASAISPPLAVVLFGLIAGADLIRNFRRAIIYWTFFGGLAGVLSFFTLGFAPWEFLGRVSLKQWNWGLHSHWKFFPLVWLGSLGWTGAWLTLALLQKKTYRVGNREWIVFLVGSFAVAYLMGEGAEVQRHVSLLGAFMGAISIWHWLDLDSKRQRSILSFTVLLAVAANLVFVLRHTKLPSDLDSGFPWKDYFVLNQKLRESRSPVLAAITPSRGGFPFAMEATTSFSTPMDVFIYHSIPSSIERLLYRAWGEYQIAPYASALGYRYVVWGPAEERAWGARVRDRFVDGRALHQVGSVGLYVLNDRVRDSAEAAETIADKLFYGEWNQEAYEFYTALNRRHPLKPHYLKRLSQLWMRAGDPSQAKIFLERAEKLNRLADSQTE